MHASAFELYRIGPGPSSSYTIGPQRAALRFVHDLAADGLLPTTVQVEAELFGGLAFLGRQHASDQAIVAGLAGHLPERCDGSALAICLSRAQTERSLLLGGRRRVRFDPERDLRMVVDQSLAQDGNAVRFLARDVGGEVVASRLYFSTGGGSVLSEDAAGAGTMNGRMGYTFGTAEELLAACQAHGKRICDLARANECALFSPGEVRAGLNQVAQAMRVSVERGLKAEGTLPGGSRRTAAASFEALRVTSAAPAQLCAAYATAVAEENASGGRVVCAPTAGAAGPVAALMQLWRESGPMQYEDRVIDFLLAGAAIGALLRSAGVKNVGCQGEVGVAAAMAAAGYASVGNGSNAQVLFAAERALEPHLGLACDPSDGRIEMPCIERNARAAAHAYQAAVAAVRMPAPRIGLDLLTRSIVESGRALSARYKSTSIGGVAVNVAEC